jgi:hypothetical protein
LPWVTGETRTTDQSLVIGNDPAYRHRAQAGSALKWKDRLDFFAALEQSHFNILPNTGDRFSKLRRETGIVQIGIGFLQGAPRGELFQV